jgi:uncharacterized protein
VDLAPGAIEFGSDQLVAPKIRQASSLRAEGSVEMVSDSLGEIRVKGHLTVRMDTDCDRCLEPASCPLDEDFELYYRPVEDGYGEEKVLDEGEAQMGFYEGDGLELNDVLREFVLLSLPMQKLCREDCKGICPVCGQNRNLNPCDCQTEAADDRWAALKEIKN